MNQKELYNDSSFIEALNISFKNMRDLPNSGRQREGFEVALEDGEYAMAGDSDYQAFMSENSLDNEEPYFHRESWDQFELQNMPGDIEQKMNDF